MKIFNLISMVVFAIMTIVTFVAGFYNPIHFLFSLMCVLLVLVAITDDTGSDSILTTLQKMWRNERSL